MKLRTSRLAFGSAATLLVIACGGDDVENPVEDNPNEVITTVTLTFTPMGGGSPSIGEFRDEDGDGGAPPMITRVTLVNGTTYTMTPRFVNELEDPDEDITPEIFAERDEHQIFVVGDVVEGPATNVSAGALVRHSYLDQDTNGFPIGLQNRVEALAAGMGVFSVGLRHMPLVNDQPVKTGVLAEVVRQGGGFDAQNSGTTLPGSWDVVVDIPLSVE